jgi:hypothetical protein
MSDKDREERIRNKAYEIWEREGASHGSHDRHWREATAHVDAESTAKPKKPAALKAPKAAKTPKAAAPKAPKPEAAAAVSASPAKTPEPKKPGRPKKVL